MRRRALPILCVSMLAAACGAPPSPSSRPPSLAIVGTPPADSPTADVLAASASPVTYERMAAFPPPGWHVPRVVAFSPDGERVTFLQSESEEERAKMSLFSFDLGTGKIERLLAAEDLAAPGGKMSIEEELRRERQRKRIEGITDYRWASKAPLLVIPHADDVFVRDAAGKVRRLTTTPAAEIDPEPCPTGEKIAFVRERELHVIDVATGREKALTRGASPTTTRGLSDFNGQEEFGELHGFFWSPDCKTLAFLEVDEKAVGEVSVLGFRGGEAQLMNQRYPRAGGANPTVRIGLIDADAGGAPRWVTWPTGIGADSYFGRFTWDKASLFVQALDRAQQRRTLLRVDAKTAQARELITESSKAWVEFRDMKLLPKSGELLWVTDGGDHHELALHDAATGERKALLATGADDVLGIAGLDEAAGIALVVRAQRHATEEHLFAVKLDGGGTPARLTPEPGVHHVDVAPDGKSFVDVHSALARTPVAVVRSIDGKNLGQLPARLDADLERLAIRPLELFEAAADDGTPLMGAFLGPEKIDPGKRYPIVWMVYGGPGVQTVQDRYTPNLVWQHLADRGFFVAQLDNRGSSGRGPEFAAPIRGRLGEVELADQIAGLDALAKRLPIDPTRVGIYGHSYGGTMAALAMFRAPDRFRVGIAGSPVSAWELYDTGYTERYMGTPADNKAGYEATNLAPLAKGLKGDLFILHAMMDENVHFEHTARLIDALVAANKPFDLLVFPGERHGYRSPTARAYAMQRVVEYLAEHLAPVDGVAGQAPVD